MAEKFGLVEAICGTVLVKKIERQKALKFLMQNSFKKRMLFIYREQSREKKVSLSACANRSCLSNTFWWFSVLSLSFSRKASLLLYCPSICRRVLGKKLHPASFSFLHTRFDSYRICRTFSNMISFLGGTRWRFYSQQLFTIIVLRILKTRAWF